jgi:DNA-binding response OmpR family regulator
MRVLLVEDDADLSKRIAASLRAENFVVDIARNGEDAEHAGLTETFDAAFLDLGLPKVDGGTVFSPGAHMSERHLFWFFQLATDGHDSAA